MSRDDEILDVYVNDAKTAVRGAVAASTGKTRVTMYLDNDVLQFFRARASSAGRGYQTEINRSLRADMANSVMGGVSVQSRNFKQKNVVVSLLSQDVTKTPSRRISGHWVAASCSLHSVQEKDHSDELSEFLGSDLSRTLLASRYSARRA